MTRYFRSESRQVLASLVLAIGLGIAIAASGRDDARRAAELVAPLGVIWVNAIRMTVVPLIVSLLVVAISSAAGSAVGKLGARTIAVFLSISGGMAIVMIPLIRLAFQLMPTAAVRPTLPSGAANAAREVAASGQVQSLGAWLISLVPANPIAAAADGALLPLVVFTMLFAVALSRIDVVAAGQVQSFFRAVADAMMVMVRWIIRLAPIGVFALILPLAARAGTGLVGAIGFYIIAYALGCLMGVALLYVVIAFITNVGIGRYARGLFPAQLIALSTASSIASLPAVIDGAERIGLPKRVTGFVLPLAASTFKAAGPVNWTTASIFISQLYGVPLGMTGLLTIAFATVFLSFGVPGIPRGAFVMLTPLFATLGLPMEGLGILIAVDAIPDTFATVLNVSGHMAAATIVAREESSATDERETSISRSAIPSTGALS